MSDETEDRTQAPLQLPRNVVIDMHHVLGKLLDDDVPPPGDTRKQLPDYILAMLAHRMYLSTACEMAQACEMAIVRHPDHKGEFLSWAHWLHDDQCRLNNKYSGVLCECPCHKKKKEARAS